MSVTFKAKTTIVHIDERTASGQSLQAPSARRKVSLGRKVELLNLSVDVGHSKRRIQVQITGMSCSSCVAKIERHLSKKTGEFVQYIWYAYNNNIFKHNS